jgi:hypothetical protein
MRWYQALPLYICWLIPVQASQAETLIEVYRSGVANWPAAETDTQIEVKPMTSLPSLPNYRKRP